MIAIRYNSFNEVAVMEERSSFDSFDTIKNKLMDGVFSQTYKDIIHVCFVAAIKYRRLDIVNFFSML